LPNLNQEQAPRDKPEDDEVWKAHRNNVKAISQSPFLSINPADQSITKTGWRWSVIGRIDRTERKQWS
jgi:hypothetical protein